MTEEELEKYLEQFPTVNHLYIQTKQVSFIFGEAKKINNEVIDLISLIKRYNDIFSDNGWIIYDSINTVFIQEVIKTFDESGYDRAEEKILEFYNTDSGNWLEKYSHSINEFRDRSDMISEALENHYNKKYFSSVPLFLVIADGIVNDFTKSKGFFAEGTNVDAWDCLVGANDGLKKLKNLYYISRKKKNIDIIKLPYRNGIIHGRDLNYGNEYNSCKCIVLLMAIADWIKSKTTESYRKEKYEKDINPPSLSESIKRYSEIQNVKKIISEWKPQSIVIGENIPSSGNVEEYSKHEYIQYLVITLNYWKNKNYGNLSNNFSMLLYERKNIGKMARECRELFENKELIDYEIKEVIDQAISMKVILININARSNDKVNNFDLKFGLIYESRNKNEVAVPQLKNGEWKIYPRDISGLYKIY